MTDAEEIDAPTFVGEILNCFAPPGAAQYQTTNEFGLAVSLHREGKLQDAAASYRRIVEASPDDLSAVYCLGVLRLQEGNIREALDYMARAVALSGGSAETSNALGQLLAFFGFHEQALCKYREAVELDGSLAEAQFNAGNSCRDLKRHQDAIRHFQAAVKTRPDYVEAWERLGIASAESGLMQESRTAFENAIQLSPRNPSYYRSLASVAEDFGARHLNTLEGLAQDASDLSTEDRIELYFALTKAYENIGCYDLASRSLIAANRLKYEQTSWDEAEALQFIQDVRKVFTRDFIATRSGHGLDTPVPVFVVGMPRSGSTLLEQILASHRDVSTMGESAALSSSISSVWPGARKRFLTNIAVASPVEFRDLATQYADRITRSAGKPIRVVDKMLTNFLYLGLLATILPGAHVIHIRRHPLDTCLSCFSTCFSGGVPYANDLGTLARYYSAYYALMLHWKATLAHGSILEVEYESLIMDPEAQTRRVFEYCGLEWNSSCLDFYLSRRVVQTASAAQVRKPLYDTSIGRWRHYRDMLKPLIEALDVPLPRES